LRTHKLGEADRIVTLLTRYEGKVRAVARGVRRTSSKFGGRLEPCSHIDVQLVRGRTLDVVAQVETVAGYSQPLRRDYALFTAAEVMLETADKLVTEEGAPAVQQYRLLVGALHALGGGVKPAPLVLDSYLLRALALAGYAPSLAVCARCGATCSPLWFSVTAGGLVCPDCRPSGAARLTPPAWQLLGALLLGDWNSAGVTPLTNQDEVHEVIHSFVNWQLEHTLRSLPLLEAEASPLSLRRGYS